MQVLLLLTYTAIAWSLLSQHVEDRTDRKGRGMLDGAETAYLAALVAVELFATWIHPKLLGEQLPFLPLMLISVYCAGGMAWIWSQPDIIEVHLAKQD